jgi:DeoR/GlpR family transcriptional regulator of sugar metabolism
MLQAERHREIMGMLAHGAMVGTSELSARLGVSNETIRRDLKLLEDENRLVRVRGGASSRAETVAVEPSFHERSGLAVGEKRAIGRLAASFIEPGMTVMIDVGTTALQVARAFPEDFHGVVATCSMLAAAELANRSGIDLLVSGGRLRAGDLALSNGLAAAFFEDLWPDVSFLSSGGVDPRAGLTDFYFDEVATRRKMVEHSAVSYVLADSSKFGKVAPHRVCDLGDFTSLITDRDPSAELQAAIEETGAHLLVTSEEPRGRGR